MQDAIAENLTRKERVGQGTVGKVKAIVARDKPLGPQAMKRVIQEVKREQASRLVRVKETRVFHGAFAKQTNGSKRDMIMTHNWLLGSKFRAVAEAFITAAQDGVILMVAYCQRVLKHKIDLDCWECHKGPEMVGHLLSYREAYQWTLFKERQNRMLAGLLEVLAKGAGLTVPERLGRAKGI